MPKILCIDDTPNEILTSGKTLKDVVNEIFRDTTYKVSFEKTGNEGVKATEKDKEIKLVLLDVEFNKKIEGPQIADELQAKAPHTKIIVLTRVDEKGKKISFGWKPNVVHYVLKKELSNVQVLQKLRNLSKAIIGDYENKNWELEYSGPCAINLTNKTNGETFGVNIPSMAERPLLACMQSPNKPVSWSVDLSTAELNKVHNAVNTNVLEGTEWKMWGILSRDKCAKGQLKLIIGSVKPLPSQSEIPIPYALQSHFEKFKRDVEERLKTIEGALNLKSSQKNK